jgi:pimeloyl-ACP methyl ester carboxylesterase
MPHVEFCQPANQGLWADLTVRLPELESSLPSIRVPFGVIVGELSPMPPSAGTESAERIPGAWSQVVSGAGHFVWHESPGCLLAGMDRLVADPSAESSLVAARQQSREVRSDLR